MTALKTESGIRALYQGMAVRKSNIMVLAGDLSKMQQKVLSLRTNSESQPEKSSMSIVELSGVVAKNLQERLQTTLMQAISKLLKVKLEDIDADTELNEYGFDSISLTEFTNNLNQEFELELTPVVIF